MYDVIYLGAGPGGYIGAVTSASMGKKVALVERDRVGGVCVNSGCIPMDSALASVGFQLYSKNSAFEKPASLNFSMNIQRAREIASKTRELAEGLLGALGVDIIKGEGKLSDKAVVVGNQRIEGENVVVATGARYDLSRAPNVNPKKIITANNFWSLSEPPEKVVLLQGGIPSIRGIELAQLLSSSGSSVTVIDDDEKLFPQFDTELTDALMSSLQEAGLTFRMKSKVLSLQDDTIHYEYQNEEHEDRFDALILSHAWLPNTENIGLSELGVSMTNGFINIDENCRTNLPWLYAVGEVTSIKGATRAMYMGRAAALTIAGKKIKVNQGQLPSGIFTIPQFAQVGLSEEAARKSYGDVVVGRSDLGFNEKAMAVGANSGLTKLIFDKRGNLLGGGLVAYDAEEIISQLAQALRLGATAEDLAFSGYEHATISESVQDAALKALNSML